MGKEVKKYSNDDHMERPVFVREHVIAYQSLSDSAHIRKMSVRQALQTGMSLEESRSLLQDRMHKDFPDVDF